MEGEDIIELDLSTNELVDDALATNCAQDFDLYIDLYSVNDVALPTIKLMMLNVMHHCCLVSLSYNFL